MTKQQALGIIFLTMFTISLLYIIYEMWIGEPIENIEIAVVVMLVSIGLGGIFGYRNKSKL